MNRRGFLRALPFVGALAIPASADKGCGTPAAASWDHGMGDWLVAHIDLACKWCGVIQLRQGFEPGIGWRLGPEAHLKPCPLWRKGQEEREIEFLRAGADS